MSLSSYLARPLRWLRAGYPAGAPRHGYVPLIALMPSPAAQMEDRPSGPSSAPPITSDGRISTQRPAALGKTRGVTEQRFVLPGPPDE